MRLLISKITSMKNHVQNLAIVTIRVSPMKLSHYRILQVHIHITNAIVSSIQLLLNLFKYSFQKDPLNPLDIPLKSQPTNLRLELF